jgi:NAD(P)-dependent dehydrogenase (short-subunit alcohol dehydrogenase family)
MSQHSSTPVPHRLEGRVALVTGAASGIGRSITERFIAEGARVLAGDVDVPGLEHLGRDLGSAVSTGHCDVTDEDQLDTFLARGIAEFGGIDVVVANAGAGTYAQISEHPLSEWQRIIDLCLTGVFLTLKHAGPHIRPGGSIITIASLNAIQPARGMAAYCAAKAGAEMLTRVAAMEFGPRNIRANTIAPGLVKTRATSGFFAVDDVVRAFEDNAPLHRHAHPDEIASVAAFLASDDSAFMSGSFLSVDGGGNTGRYPDLPAIFERLSR